MYDMPNRVGYLLKTEVYEGPDAVVEWKGQDGNIVGITKISCYNSKI